MKNFIRSIVVAVFAVSIVGCGGGGGDSILVAPELQSIKVEATRMSLEAGASTQLHAIGHYSDGTTADTSTVTYPATSITWTASDSDIATLIGTTLYTRKTGTLVVTARDFFSNVTGSATITVTAAIPTSISISGFDTTSYSARESRILTASAKNSDGSTTAIQSPTWSSSNPGVFTVDAYGNFQAVGAGTASVIAAFGSQTDTKEITIVAAANPPKFIVSCDPVHPTVISAQDWNTEYAKDHFNTSEWIVVDGVSCQAYKAVELLVPELASLYAPIFIANRSTANPATFLPGMTYSSGNSPQLSSGQVLNIGSTDGPNSTSFVTLYTINAN